MQIDDDMKMRCIISLWVFSLALFLTGCSSVGYRSNSYARPKSFEGVQFRVAVAEAEFDMKNAGVVAQAYSPEAADACGAVSVERLNAQLCREYPKLFTSAQNAIPLRIKVKMYYDNNYGGRMGGAVLCGFTFGLVPFVMRSDYDFDIRFDSDTFSQSESHPPCKVLVQRCGWGSIIPTGYIPYPGHTDTPRDYMTGPMNSEQGVSERGKDFIASQVGKGVVQIISQVPADDWKRYQVIRRITQGN